MRRPTIAQHSQHLSWFSSPYWQDPEVELLRRILVKLEALSSSGYEAKQSDMLEMYRLLLLLEVNKRASRQAAGREVERVDWARLLPLLLAAGVVLGVVVAQLLGLDMRGAL